MVKKPILQLILSIAGIYVILHFLDNNLHILAFGYYIKQIAWTIFLVSGTVLAYMYLSPARKKAPAGQAMSQPGQQQQQVKIETYGFNRIRDIDKLLATIGGRATWLHFPPHTAKFVMNTAPKNSHATVHFNITNHTAADGKPMFELITILSGNRSFDIASVAPPAPANGKPVEITGTITEYQLDEKGIAAGFIMGKYIVEIPKHLSVNMLPLLKHAKFILVKGYERNSTDGFVNTTGFLLLKPYGITLDQTNYLL